MTTRAWFVALMIGALLLLPFGVLQYRIAKSRAFCDAVEIAPQSELDQVASRCDRLMRERGGPETGWDSVKDASTLAQFALAGITPYEIVVGKGAVVLKYIPGNWRYSTIAIWEEDLASNGDRIRVLKITYGTYGWRILSQREGGHGEPDRAGSPSHESSLSIQADEIESLPEAIAASDNRADERPRAECIRNMEIIWGAAGSYCLENKKSPKLVCSPQMLTN